MSKDPERPQYTRYRSRPRLPGRLGERSRDPEFKGVELRDDVRRGPRHRRRARRPLSVGRVVRYVVLAAFAWLALSFVLFMVSSQVEQGKVSDAASRTLDTAGPMPVSANTILVLGSDARPKGSKEGGANVVGEPSRADTILLMRAGGGSSSRLAIPRDTVVDIPGHGRDKINAAFAIGGPALTITTVKSYLGIDVNHVMEVNFDNFPDFIDAMGGINISDVGCVKANLDGTDQDGGTTIDIRAGQKTHLDGRHVLGLARVRKNDCDPGQDDTDRAERQQKILGAIKGRLISPPTFVRLPWVSWNAPKAVRTDMNGLSLLGLFAAIQTASTPTPNVLKPSGFETTPGGGSGLTVSDDEKRAAVRKFLEG